MSSGEPTREIAATALCVVFFNALILIAILLLAPDRPARRGDGGEAAAKSSLAQVGSSMEVDLNTATLRELAGLPGIGVGRARRILEDRDARGPFPTLDALDRVPGIGPGTIARLRGAARADRAAPPPLTPRRQEASSGPRP